MKHSRNFLFFAAGLILVFVLAACSSNSTTSSGSQSSNSSSGCGRYCTGSSTPTPGSSGSAVTIKTATMTVKGKALTVLVNSQGMTLYYRTSDTTSSVCSGGCASAWPPVLSTSTPSSVTTLPGTLSVLTDANGSQVSYNGHPLYTYAGDTAPGQINGEGIGGVWFVASTDVAASSGSNSNGNGYGYPGYGQ
jgi:predicted lipoprotein with Yx(FWY)xxD motif